MIHNLGSVEPYLQTTVERTLHVIPQLHIRSNV
jgi:hypothetical protein